MRRSTALLILSLLLAACRSAEPRRPAVVEPSPEAPPIQEPVPPPDDALSVKQAEEEVVVAAWSEPKNLPPGGGQSQVLVRAQKRGGAPFPGVEVRLKTSTGSLYSRGKVLVTDARGMTRDRLTAQKTAQITLNAGGTRYRFNVPVLPGSPE